MRDITDLMNAYRECWRNLWNVYFAKREYNGCWVDRFEQVRRLLFTLLVVDELFYTGEADEENMPPPALKVVPKERSLILIERPSPPGEAGYWDQEKDLVVGPDDITLLFVEYFDFATTPVIDLRYYLCRILSFPNHVAYEGRKALIEAVDGRVFHDEEADDTLRTG